MERGGDVGGGRQDGVVQGEAHPSLEVGATESGLIVSSVSDEMMRFPAVMGT